MNIFKICNKCLAVDAKKLERELRKIDREANIEVRCVNLCGIGRTKPFVVVNGIPIIEENMELLLERVKQAIK